MPSNFDRCRRDDGTIDLIQLYKAEFGFDACGNALGYLTECENMHRIVSRQSATIAVISARYIFLKELDDERRSDTEH